MKFSRKEKDIIEYSLKDKRNPIEFFYAIEL